MTNMAQYIRLTKGVKDSGRLIKPEDLQNNIKNWDEDYYISTYFYNEEHFKQFKKTRSISGIRDVTTNKVWFDFDSKIDLSLAQKDTAELVNRLIKHNIKEKDIEVYFTGSKGFHVIITIKQNLDPSTVQAIATKFAQDLNTFDLSLYDASQLLRVPFTRNEKTGLYKVPLSVVNLNTLNIEEIKQIAVTNQDLPEYDWGVVEPTEEFFIIPPDKKVSSSYVPAAYSLDLSKKPKQWRNCKWSLMQGNFGDEPGERHDALTILAATARGMNFDKDTAYYLCKSALKKQAARSGREEFDKEELYNNIINSIYKPSHEGGQYTCQKPGWLQNYCKSLDHPCEKHSDNNVVKIEDAFGLFKDYANNIDNLTIKTGIPALDRKLRMTVGMSVGIVAPPGVGKTSLAIQILNNMSKNNEQAIFLSYDMFHSLVVQKLIQKHFNLQPSEIFQKFKNKDENFQAQVLEVIKEEYKNVHFCFKAGQTYNEILDTIKEVEDSSGKKAKLLVCDYNELVLTDMSDGTSSSNYVAQKMREIANVNEMCVLSLFQPNKMSGSPSDEITSYRSAKGGSGIEQSVSIMLGMSRPGYNPRKPESDKFMSINCLKNRMGSLFAVDLRWDGLAGSLSELTMSEVEELKELRTNKENEKKDDGWG